MINVGAIGASLEMTDKSFSSTLEDGEKALKRSGLAAELFGKELDEAYGSIARTTAAVDKMKKEAIEGAAASKTLGGAISLFAESAGFAVTPAGALLSAVSAIGAALLAIPATVAAAAVGIGVMTTKAAALGDELLTTSKSTDISVEALSGYRFVAEQTGVAFSQISSSVSKFESDLGRGSKKFKDAIGDLHLSITDLRNSKPEDAFQKVIDGLGKVPNAADRAAVGTAIFGNQFRKLKPLIDEDVKGMIADFQAFGGVVTTEMAVAGDAFNDAKSRLSFMVEAAETQLGAIFVPVVAAAFKAVGDAWVDVLSKTKFNAAQFVETVDKVGTFLIEFTGTAIEVLGELTKALVIFFSGKYIGEELGIVRALSTIGEQAARLGEIFAILNRDTVGQGFFGGMADFFKGTKDFAIDTSKSVNEFVLQIVTAADTVSKLGAAVREKGATAVKEMRDAITAGAEAARQGQGAFQGLGEEIDKTLAKWAKYQDKIEFDAHKRGWKLIEDFNKAQIKEATERAKTIGKLFLEEIDMREDADRTMRRLTERQAQFEINETQRVLDKKKAYYAVLQSMGFDVSKNLIAADQKAAAAMIEVTTKTDEFKVALAAVLAIAGPFGGAMAHIDKAIDGVEEAFDDTIEKSQEFKQQMVSLANSVANAFVAAFKSDNFGKSIVDSLSNIVGSFAQSAAQKAVKEGLARGTMSTGQAVWQTVGTTIGVAIGSQIALTAYDLLSGEFDRRDRESQQLGQAMASQFAQGFGGFRGLRDVFRQIGIDTANPAYNVFGSDSAEQVAAAIARVQPLIDEWTTRMKGLGAAAEGANVLVKGLAINFGKSMTEQIKAAEMANKAIIDAMKERGDSSNKISAMEDLLAEKMKNQTFTATEAQIAAFNRAGTIVGGVIANTVNQTGDLVGAIMQSADALETLSVLRDKFQLGDQLSAATQQVLGLYDTIKNNEDVFTSISGVGQVMRGLGDALVYNQDLAAAFGQELAADFQTLKDRGVDVNTIYAAMAPQLQQLWELQKDGRITLDETTKAMLEQAEAAGVVGDKQRSINEQILNVLTEIRDLIGFVGNVALPRMGTAAENAGRAVSRSLNGVASAGMSAAGAVRQIEEGLSGIKAPPPITIDVSFDVETPDWDRYRPEWTYGSPEGPAASYRHGSDGFQDFGDGTPAMLHGLERVQTYDQYQAERAGGGIPPGVIVELDGDVLIAYNARNSGRWERIRAGRSTRTFGG